MCRKLIYLACFVIVFGFYGTITSGQENQIVNGEFDDGFEPWGIYAYLNTAEGFTVDIQSAGLSGPNAAMIDITNSPALVSIGIAQGGLLIEHGVTYPIGFTAKAEQDRGMVVLLQANINNASYPTFLDETVELTTTARDYVIEYTHNGETIGDEEGENLILYIMIKGPSWNPPGANLNGRVWIDRVYFGAEIPRQPVYRVTDPNPKDGYFHMETWISLGWSPGDYAVSHDVYISENFDDVNEATRDSDVFQSNTTDEYIFAGFQGFPYPEGLIPGTTYYWRVDEVNDAEPDSPWKGPVWSFTIPPKTAYSPNPADGAFFVDPDGVLNWNAGLGARQHYVYFGDNYADVEAGTGDTDKGESTNTSFTLGTLELEKTYYWRVDETDAIETHTGDVWSFTVAKEGGGLKAEYFNNITLYGEPVLTRLDPQIDFNWGNGSNRGSNSPAENINVDNFSARWSGDLEVDLTDTYTFRINANNGFRLWLNEELIIDFWDNPTTSNLESEPIELIGNATYPIRMEYYEGVGTAVARLFWENSVREEQIIPQAALSLPMKANHSNPSNNAVDMKQTTVLEWAAGENAASHQIYFGTDEQAVRNADTSSPEYKGTRDLGAESYDPGQLEWNTTYYWRVDEVNSVHPESPWTGSIWSFTTADFLIVDNFEDYNDFAPDRIFDFWVDGYGIATNGSTVGYSEPDFVAGEHFVETSIVHSGFQSMPFFYNNSSAGSSEATLTLVYPRDWTERDVSTLTLWFIGDLANAAELMYVVLDGTAVVYQDNPDAALITEWTQWNIELQAFADQGVDLTDVDTIGLGFGDRNNPYGGSGLVFFDDIGLHLSLDEPEL